MPCRVRAAGRLRRAGINAIVIASMILGIVPSLLPGLSTKTASGHNLDASAVYAYLDPDTQAMLDARINSPGWTPPASLLLAGDELGLVIKAVPDNGTAIGVGGYTTFYVPNGLQVLGAAYLVPGNDPSDGITGYDKAPMKGQALMPAIGAGAIPL